jgi:hypothetical protein
MPADDLRPGLAAEMFEADWASSDLGIELLELGDGTATVRMTIGRSMMGGRRPCGDGHRARRVRVRRHL